MHTNDLLDLMITTIAILSRRFEDTYICPSVTHNSAIYKGILKTFGTNLNHNQAKMADHSNVKDTH